MSTISNSSASTLLTALDPNDQPAGQKAATQALNALKTALQSGNVGDAQSALASLQKTLAQSSSSQTTTDTSNPSTSPFGSNSKANTDYNNLVDAVNSGNTTDAQTALSNLQSDLKTRHGGGHHGHGAPPPTQVSTVDTTPSSDSTSSTSGNYVNVTV